MQSLPFVRYILREDAVTRGLGDSEASLIVDWLAGRVERIACDAPNEANAWTQVYALCRHARIIGTFVRLWTNPASRGSAIQLIANERLSCPLPQADIDPSELMEGLLRWHDYHHNLLAESKLRAAA